MAPKRISEEWERAETEYFTLFNEWCPLTLVGLKRVFAAIDAKVPIPESEYHKRDWAGGREEKVPTHCSAGTLEEEEDVIEYERLFGEECPLVYVAHMGKFNLIKEAIKAGRPIPKSEYAHLIGCAL